MLTLNPPLNVRLASQQDQDFFRSLYATTRDELKALGLPPQQFAELLLSQQQIQEHGVRLTYPNAQQWLIYLEHDAPVKIGRLIIDFTDNDWRVIDIAILPEFRNQGWGTQIMQAVMNKARQTSGSVSLAVLHFNHGAKQLYHRLGFTLNSHDTLQLQLIWRSALVPEV